MTASLIIAVATIATFTGCNKPDDKLVCVCYDARIRSEYTKYDINDKLACEQYAQKKGANTACSIEYLK